MAFVQPGEMQPETDFNFQGEDAKAVRVQDRAARRGSKWFSFDVPVEQDHPMTLIVTYNSGERRRCDFDILVNDMKMGEQKDRANYPGTRRPLFRRRVQNSRRNACR